MRCTKDTPAQPASQDGAWGQSPAPRAWISVATTGLAATGSWPLPPAYSSICELSPVLMAPRVAGSTAPPLGSPENSRVGVSVLPGTDRQDPACVEGERLGRGRSLRSPSGPSAERFPQQVTSVPRDGLPPAHRSACPASASPSSFICREGFVVRRAVY